MKQHGAVAAARKAKADARTRLPPSVAGNPRDRFEVVSRLEMRGFHTGIIASKVKLARFSA
jgi:hypothetical protein